jgi:hypothetical protein
MNGELYPLLDKHGIEFNASTYSEMVQFYITGAKSNFNIAAETPNKIEETGATIMNIKAP